MANNLYSQFRKVKHYGGNKLLSELELNFKWYFDWSFLKIGGWTNVESGVTQGYFGGNFYELKPVHDPSYNDGQVWESVRKDWCFETGVNYNTEPRTIVEEISHIGGGTGLISTTSHHQFLVGDTVTITDSNIEAYNDTFVIVGTPSDNQLHVTTLPNSGVGFLASIYSTTNPLSVSVSVNGTGIETNTAGLEHHINYPLGRVIFDTALNTGTSSVIAQYSFRDVQTYIADSVPWMVEFQMDSLRPDHPNWDNIDFIDKGEWSLNAPHRIQLPAIVLESVDYRGGRPFELGHVAMWENPEMVFHVLAENRFDRNNLVSILMDQKHHTIFLFDSDELADMDYFPLDYKGMVTSSPMMYENIVVDMTHLRWLKCWIKDMNVFDVKTQTTNLHYARVRAVLEVVIGDSL